MRLFLISLIFLLCGASAQAQNCTTEDFEGVSPGTYTSTGVAALNSSTVLATLGGPGLVEPGCTYTTTGVELLWWDAPTWLVSQCISSTWSAQIAIEYDSDVDNMSVELHGFFADTVDATAYDAAGNVLQQQVGIPVAALASSTVSFSGGGIRKVEFLSALTGGDSAFIGEHTYCMNTGPQLSLAGSCPGVGTLSGSGMTPSGQVLIGWSTVAASWTVPAAGAICANTAIGIVQPTLLLSAQADGAGNFSIPVNIPPGACGLAQVQGLDRVSCTPTNVLSI